MSQGPFCGKISSSPMTSKAKHVYEFGAFRLDATDRVLFRDDRALSLPPKVFDTLLLLVTNNGRVLEKDEMMKQLWPDTFVEEGTLAQYISLLRKALGDSASWTKTSRGGATVLQLRYTNCTTCRPNCASRSIPGAAQ